jgi:hypothetical protein
MLSVSVWTTRREETTKCEVLIDAWKCASVDHTCANTDQKGRSSSTEV